MEFGQKNFFREIDFFDFTSFLVWTFLNFLTHYEGHYDNPQTGIGLILGTGCNGAYLEDADKITNWHQGNKGKAKEVIIDPEFGAFGDNGCIDFVKTEADEELDLNSLLPRGNTI